MIPIKRIIPILFLLQLFFHAGSLYAAKPEETAVTHVKNSFAFTKELNLSARISYDFKLITKSKVVSVESADSIPLSSVTDYTNYIDLFCGLICSQARLLSEGEKIDKDKLKQAYASVEIKNRIQFSAKRDMARLTFFTASLTNTLTMWRITVRNNGLVKKIQRSVISIY